MKKVIVFLLVGLILIGTCAIVAAEEQEDTDEIDVDFSESTVGEPIPCGGGEGGQNRSRAWNVRSDPTGGGGLYRIPSAAVPQR